MSSRRRCQSCQGSEAYAHQPTVAVAAPTKAATGVEKPAPRLMATIPAATSNVSNEDTASGRCGNILQSFSECAVIAGV